MPESLWPRFPTVPVSRISIKPKESRNHKTVSQPCLGYNLKWESHRDFFYITTKPEGRLFSLRRSIFKSPTCGRDIHKKNHSHLLAAWSPSKSCFGACNSNGKTPLEWSNLILAQVLNGIPFSSNSFLQWCRTAGSSLANWQNTKTSKTFSEVYAFTEANTRCTSSTLGCSYSLPRVAVLFDASYQRPKLLKNMGQTLFCSCTKPPDPTQSHSNLWKNLYTTLKIDQSVALHWITM